MTYYYEYVVNLLPVKPKQDVCSSTKRQKTLRRGLRPVTFESVINRH